MESTYQPLSIDLRQPSSAALQAAIQAALAERGWSDPSDSVMAEYVLVMLANAKRRDQIDAELTELIGSDYNSDFTRWLWAHASGASASEQGSIQGAAASSTLDSATTLGVVNAQAFSQQEPVAESSSKGRYSPGYDSERVRHHRRSQSPPRRRGSRSPPPRGQGPDLFGRADHWTPRQRGSSAAEERWPRTSRHRQRREPRELFATAVSTASRQGFRASSSSSSETMEPIEEEPQEQTLRAASELPQNNDPPTAPRNMRIRGQARAAEGPAAPRELFMRTAGEINSSAGPRPPTGPRAQNGGGGGRSLFARAGIPDPRAPAFVPTGPSAPQEVAVAPSTFSLAARIDPMVPDNSTATSPEAAPPTSQSFPTEPPKSSLCRYASSCTNPMCEFSHPSPASAIAKKRGEIKDDPIITSEQSCNFGVRCTKIDCPFSHVSPAVFFVGNKAFDAAPPTSTGDTTQFPCRFADECSNPSCAYAHFDAQGNLAPSPALARLVNPTFKASEQSSDSRVDAADSDGDVDFDMVGGEGEGSAGSSAPTERGFDGKPAALDRALGDGATSSSAGARPCKFGAGCTRADCWFSHPASRRIGGNGASSSMSAKPRHATALLNANGDAALSGQKKLHVSDRLSRFNREGDSDAMDGEVERIIPVS